MDTDSIIFVVVFGLFAVGSIALANRLTGTRRRLRRHGIKVNATIDKQQHGHDMPTIYDLHFTTVTGEKIEKRLKGNDVRDVTPLVYDPDNPKRAWPPDKIFGTGATVQIGCLWTFGVFCALLFLFGVATLYSVPPAAVTIETKLDFSARPIAGTFEVTQGADTLGCSHGTSEATFDEPTEDVTDVMTCSEGDTGTFTIVFDPDGYDTGPGDQNGPWHILSGSGDFAGLQGEGDFWLVTDDTPIGVTTYSGDIEYTS